MIAFMFCNAWVYGPDDDEPPGRLTPVVINLNHVVTACPFRDGKASMLTMDSTVYVCAGHEGDDAAFIDVPFEKFLAYLGAVAQAQGGGIVAQRSEQPAQTTEPVGWMPAVNRDGEAS